MLATQLMLMFQSEHVDYEESKSPIKSRNLCTAKTLYGTAARYLGQNGFRLMPSLEIYIKQKQLSYIMVLL